MILENHNDPDDGQHGGVGNPAEQGNLPDENDDLEEIEEGDIAEVIDLDEGIAPEDVMADEMDDMELDNAAADSDEQDEGMGDEALHSNLDDAVRIFKRHTGSVFCCDVDPVKSSLAVTGGEDDTAYVWNLSDTNLHFQCTGHSDSVTCTTFSHDASMLATADMAGNIKVWNCADGKEVWNYEVGDIEWLCWHCQAPVLLAGTVDGNMWMWKIPGGDCKTFQSHGASCNVGKFMPDGKRACAGYADGSVKVWDLKSAAHLHNISGHLAHKDCITSMDVHPDNTLLLTGSTDNTAKITNTQTGKVVATFKVEKSKTAEDEESSVEAVGFCPTQSYAAVGGLDGTLTVWDIPTQTSRVTCQHQAGIVRLAWSNDDPLVYTATLDGSVHLWDSRTGNCERQWFGHSEEVLDMTISRNGKFIVTASGDRTARIFSASGGGPT